MFFSLIHTNNFSKITFRFIQTEESGHIFTIILNRPEKRNAFTPTMVNELVFALEYAQNNKNIWCIAIKGNGPVFCAGMDLNVFQNPALDIVNDSLPEPNNPVNIGEAFRSLDKPTIAIVTGPVLAGGFLIVGGCSLVIATEDASFSLPEVKRGIFPMQVISTLLNFTSKRQALRMCVLAETLTAKEAKEFGLVTHLCNRESIDSLSKSVLDTLLSHSPFAISKGMAAFRAIENYPEYAKFGFLKKQLADIRESKDANEGISAFKEKRQPEWKNN